MGQQLDAEERHALRAAPFDAHREMRSGYLDAVLAPGRKSNRRHSNDQ